ncbi:ATP-binding protein [Streptomyces sp. NPDC003077]|uniref:ATP-binding protein n=1 Tax=Streptomyces sp. NPDC003077 TaxID=3154443 RepID=UPI0033B0F72C
MVKLPLKVGQEHVAKLARMHDPVGAIEELVWNALDADAERVTVEFETNQLGGIERVVVTDDGTGMAAERCAEHFQPIGTSWKRRAETSPVKKRALHGKNGQGRIRAFALGNEVRWTSVSEGAAGRQRVVIESDRRAMHEFDVSDAEPTDAPTGTVFEALGGAELRKLSERTAVTTLTAALALHLEAYPDIEVIYDGERLDPAELQPHIAEYPLPAPSGRNDDRPPLLKIIEWSRPVTRALILCDARGMSLAQLRPDIQAPGFHFTAYLSWSAFADEPGDLSLADWEPDGAVARVIGSARDRMRAHFRLRAERRRQEIVRAWQAEGIYPYRGEPAGHRERAERETFDTVATTVVRHLPNVKRTRRMTLAFLRAVLSHEPGDVLRIVEEIFALTRQEHDDLARLLDRTPLSSLIKASTRATGRLDFLAALEHLVFEPESRSRLKERAALHKVLENESWVFGEEYALHVSDRSLEEVLRQHRALLGRPPAGSGPVLREDGRRGIVDLMLSRAARQRQGERHHLVVELKRPKVVLGMPELEQITGYAEAVMSDDRFRDTRVTWDFWLVGNSMSSTLRQVAHQRDRVPGCAVEHPAHRVWVRTWGEIIQDCEERLRFYHDQLDYQSANEHATDYLIRQHPDVVPELIPSPARPTP